MKMSQFISITLVIILGMFLNTCGQMTYEDEGMGSKSIGEDSGTTDNTTTTDTTAPTVSSTSPSDGDNTTTNISTVTVTFSELIDKSTLTTSTFTLIDNSSNSVSGTVNASDNDAGMYTTLTFTPESTLTRSVKYTATLSTGITDLNGNGLSSSYSFSFTQPDYYLGDTGTGGGLVYYIKSATSDGWRYLEASSSDNGVLPWDTAGDVYGSVLVGTSLEIGTGQANTTAIVNRLGTGSYAARTCSDLSSGGKSDWFLPSQKELYYMHQLHAAGLGSFSADTPVYWSSSEASDINNPAMYAALQVFGSTYSHGSQIGFNVDDLDNYGRNPKIFSYRVRCARSF